MSTGEDLPDPGRKTVNFPKNDHGRKTTDSPSPWRKTMDVPKIDPWRMITEEELAKHDNVNNNDAWMAIRGVVYDVAHYASAHPGGPKNIQKFAGKDGTEMFNMVHNYVNIESILGPHQVGVLKGARVAARRSSVQPKKGCCSCCCCSCLANPYKPPMTHFRQDSIIATYVIEFRHPSHESDWSVGILDARFLQVYKCVDTKKAWLSTYELPETLYNNTLELDFKHNFEYAEITLRKPIPTTVWAKQTHGLSEAGEYVPIQEGHAKFDAFITYKKCVTQNMIMFGIQIVKSCRIGVPIGLHVNLFHGDIVRPYTPVCYCIYESNIKEMPPLDGSTILYFIIKIYPDGKMSQALDAIELDDGNEVPTLQVSMPYGTFDRRILDKFSILLLIAGGSGITPMLKIIKSFWTKKDVMHGRRVAFMYFAQKVHDLVWRDQFENTQDENSWFFYFPILTKPSEQSNWQGLTGRVNSEMIRTCLNRIPIEKGLKVSCVCGPPGFNSATLTALAGIVLSENIYIFAG